MKKTRLRELKLPGSRTEDVGKPGFVSVSQIYASGFQPLDYPAHLFPTSTHVHIPPNLGAEFLETGPSVEEPMVTSVQSVQAREKSQGQARLWLPWLPSPSQASQISMTHLAWTSAAFSCAKAHTRSRCPYSFRLRLSSRTDCSTSACAFWRLSAP